MIVIEFDFTSCTLCPRKCHADRSQQKGFCGGTDTLQAASAMLHFWEEPCISGVNGSGAVFFSGCALKCCFCQNQEISLNHYGKEISIQRLSEIFLELQEQGAHNLNLVTAGHVLPWVVPALEAVKEKLSIPVVYNSGGYELVSALKWLDGLVDIYLPDFKFFYPETAQNYAHAPDYPEIAELALTEMLWQTGKPVFQENLLKKGCILRHLVMPSHRHESIALLKHLAEKFSTEQFLLSLMAQYTPVQNSDFPELNRRITKMEYQSVLKIAQELGFSGFSQEKSSAQSEYTPDFALQGL